MVNRKSRNILKAEGSIVFLGDLFMGKNPVFSIAPEVEDVLDRADLVVGNLEGQLTRHDQPVVGKLCLRSSPQAADILKSWHVDVVSIANNHIFDHGWRGFEETCRALDESGILYLGAGENLAAASKPLLLDVRSIRIGFLACSERSFHTAACAAEDSHGFAPLDEALMISQVKDLVKRTDLVIVQPHWGLCNYILPLPQHVALAKKLLAAGAAAVIGHHSHTVQGVDRRDDGVIAYNLGNFVFAADYRFHGRPPLLTKENLKGAMLILHLKEGSISNYEMFFTVQRKNLIEADNTARRAQEFAKRSALLSASDYPRLWRRYARRYIIRRLLNWANILNWPYIRKDTLKAAWQLIRLLKKQGEKTNSET
jgi:hypothetical protein